MIVLLGSSRFQILSAFGGLVDNPPAILLRCVDVRLGRWHRDLVRVLSESFVRLDKVHFRSDLVTFLRMPRNITICKR